MINLFVSSLTTFFICIATSLGLCSLSFAADASISTMTTKAESETTITVGPPPAVFTNPSLTNNTIDPNFDPSVSDGDYRKKYYQSCFVYIFIKTFARVQIINLSTHKVSSCPEKEFLKIPASSVTAQLATVANVTLVGMVGPNIQLMDENNSSIEAPSLPIGNLNFSAVMYADIGIGDLFKSFNFFRTWKQLRRWSVVDTVYNPIATRRNMDFVFYQGRTVYTLISDTGKKYVMAFYNPADIQNFKTEEYLIDRLNNLGNVLALPPGWTYKPVVLDKVLRLKQIPFQGYAGETITDELQNVYVLATDLPD